MSRDDQWADQVYRLEAEITRLKGEVDRLTEDKKAGAKLLIDREVERAVLSAQVDSLRMGNKDLQDHFDCLKADYDTLRAEAATLCAENEKLRKAAHNMLDHHYNCFGECNRYAEAVAKLARTSGYENSLFEDDIAAALSQQETSNG